MKNDLLKLKKYLDQSNNPQKSQELDFLIRIAQDLEHGHSLRKNAYSATELLGGAAGGLAGGSFGGNLLESFVSGAGGSANNAYVAKIVGELGGGALGAWLGSKYAPKAYSHLFESTTAADFEGKIKELAIDGKEYSTNSWDDPTVSGVSNLDRDNYYIKVTLGQTPSVFNLVKDDFTLGNTFVFGPNSNPDYVVDKAKAIQIVEAGKQDLPANQKFVAEKFLEELSGAAPVTTSAPITTPIERERPESLIPTIERPEPVRPTIERPIAVAPSTRPPTPVSPVAPGSRAGRREQRQAIRDFVRSRRR